MLPVIPAWLATVGKVAEAAAPFLGFAGSIFGSSQESKNVKATNETQLQIARENNSAQERMLDYNNKFNRMAALEMFNLENEYNSPANMRRLLEEGGYNPATMYNNGSAVAQSDASTPQASSSGITPSMPNLIPPPSTIGAMFGQFETLTRSLSNIANSNLTNAQKDRLTFLLGAEYKELLASAKFKDAQAEVQIVQTNFEKAFGKINRETELGLKVSQIWDNYQSACLKAVQGDAVEADKLYKQSMTDLNSLDYKIKKSTMDSIIKSAEQNYVNLVKEGKRIDSATNLNYASAAKETAQAGVLREEQRRLVDTYQSFIDEYNAKSGKEVLDFARQLATQKAQIKQILDAAGKTDAEKQTAYQELDRAYQLAELARKENSTYYARQFVQALGTLLGGTGVLIGVSKVFGNSKPNQVKGFK